MNSRSSEPPLPDPLGFFITWVTYGTWLPGDGRGWVEYRHGFKLPDPIRELEARAKMTEDACRLSWEQRKAVEAQVTETCLVRGWNLHAVNCRSNHLHLVVSANRDPKVVRSQIKAWCTRRLKALAKEQFPGTPVRENWWAERGSQRWINDQDSLESATLYTRDAQDKPH